MGQHEYRFDARLTLRAFKKGNCGRVQPSLFGKCLMSEALFFANTQQNLGKSLGDVQVAILRIAAHN